MEPQSEIGSPREPIPTLRALFLAYRREGIQGAMTTRRADGSHVMNTCRGALLVPQRLWDIFQQRGLEGEMRFDAEFVLGSLILLYTQQI